jgi:tRNA G10  N-methylase Trm11
MSITFIYTYTCTNDEVSLCELEQRSMFGKHAQSNILESELRMDPSRSPFISSRLDVLYEGHSLQDIVTQVSDMSPSQETFKVVFNQHSQGLEGMRIRYEQRRTIEREIGLNLKGEADLIAPERVYGVMIIGERWLFGVHNKNEAIWLKHMNKPQAYSTALSTRLARAVINIAIPHPAGIRAIDPCCGMGTVLVEALSMGIDITGRDINPLVTQGARENIAHFGLVGEVISGAIQQVTDTYDVAIIDMPYNLCSVISAEDQLMMLQSAARMANRVVVITIESIDSLIESAGLVIVDRCIAKKGVFVRQIMVVQSEMALHS